MISSYMKKGGCPVATAGREEIFPKPRRNDVVTLPVTINGVRGNFILDTGATFVSLKSSFAQKAEVLVDHDSVIRLNTANGIAEGKRGRAKTIQLRTLQASDVPVVVSVRCQRHLWRGPGWTAGHELSVSLSSGHGCEVGENPGEARSLTDRRAPDLLASLAGQCSGRIASASDSAKRGSAWPR